jgi:hypothetical protein
MSERCCAAAPHPGDYVCVCVDGRRREKKHQVGPAWSSVTHQVLTDRGPLVSIHRSSQVRQCAHFFPSCSTAAAAQGSALAPIAPVICQNICRRAKSFHSMAMTLEPAKATDWVRSYQEAAHKNDGQEKEKGDPFYFLRVREFCWPLSFLVPFSPVLLFISPFQARFPGIGTLVFLADPPIFFRWSSTD